MVIEAVRTLDAPDEEVVERVRAGETALYEVIMRRYNQRLYRIAWAILRDPVEAEDVVQEAHVLAYRHLDQFAGKAKFSTWLARIASNEALARLRKWKMDREPEDIIEALQSSARSPEAETLGHETRAILEASLEALPDGLRAVFMMREIEEMSTAETAECLGLSEENVKIRLYRARKLLREDLYARVGAVSAQAFQFLGPRCDRVVRTVMKRISK